MKENTDIRYKKVWIRKQERSQDWQQNEMKKILQRKRKMSDT